MRWYKLCEEVKGVQSYQCDNVTRLFWIHHEEPIKKTQHNKTFEIFSSFTRESWRCKTLAHGNPGISNPLYSKLGVIQLRQLCQTRAHKTEAKASCELKPQSKSKYWKLDYLQWWFCSKFFNYDFNFNLNRNFPHPILWFTEAPTSRARRNLQCQSHLDRW